jgi:DinB superfamily
MADDSTRAVLRTQLDLEWRFACDFVIGKVDGDEALWSPGGTSYTVHLDQGGAADWPDEASDPPMTTTIAWILWHIEWWWSDALARVRGEEPIAHEDCLWSGGTDRIATLKEEWDRVLETQDLDRPIDWVASQPQTLGSIAAWLNFELAKNLAEINQLRMLRAAVTHASRTSGRRDEHPA